MNLIKHLFNFRKKKGGKYDFLDIYKAPDEETAAKVSMISLANGATLAESWTAIPYKNFLKLIDEI